jgi:hypothetical protein
MYNGLHVKYPLFLSDFNETWIFWQITEKCLKIKFHENTSSVNRVVQCVQTHMYDEADSRFSQFCERA